MKAILFFILGFLIVSVVGLTMPYPPSTIGITFDWSSHAQAAAQSDNWPITWAGDGEQYTSWGDGRGFNQTATLDLGVSKIIGDSPETYSGLDMWTQKDGKSVGIIAVDGLLYMWVSPGSLKQAFKEQRLYQSQDRGVSWSKATWAFVFDDLIFKPSFLQFGQDYTGARDEYVYSYAPTRKKNDFVIQKPGEIILMRVPKNLIMQRAAYEFFTGNDANNQPQWSSVFAERRPVFTDPSGVMMTSVSFNPTLGRYLLITQHTQHVKGNIGIYDAPEPWGPWTTLLRQTGWGEGEIGLTSFVWNFSQKWASGLDFVLVFTGTKSLDAWNTIRGQFIAP